MEEVMKNIKKKHLLSYKDFQLFKSIYQRNIDDEDFMEDFIELNEFVKKLSNLVKPFEEELIAYFYHPCRVKYYFE